MMIDFALTCSMFVLRGGNFSIFFAAMNPIPCDTRNLKISNNPFQLSCVEGSSLLAVEVYPRYIQLHLGSNNEVQPSFIVIWWCSISPVFVKLLKILMHILSAENQVTPYVEWNSSTVTKEDKKMIISEVTVIDNAELRTAGLCIEFLTYRKTGMICFDDAELMR
ncbi:hypothetical protein ABKN59_003507 [Abortiporus biennis]